MRWLRAVGLGFRGARRRPGLVAILWLAALVPALALAIVAWAEIAGDLSHSLLAGEALRGGRAGVWSELRGPESDLDAVWSTAILGALAMIAIHALVAAGIVETLLGRHRRGERPFLRGVALHGWRFLRSAVWFLVVALPLAGAAGAAMALVTEKAPSGAAQLAGWAAILAGALLLYMPLDLAYDLSRIAAAAHGDGRMFVGFVRALGHAFRRGLVLFPLWLLFTLTIVALHLGWIAARAELAPRNAGEVVLVLAAQQAVFLLAAFLRVGLWSAEVGYVQGAGDPRWAGRRRERRVRTGSAGG